MYILHRRVTRSRCNYQIVRTFPISSNNQAIALSIRKKYIKQACAAIMNTPGFCGPLGTIAFKWTFQGVQCFKASFWSLSRTPKLLDY